MKGVVFTEFLDMVEQRYGLEVLDAVLEASGIEHLGAYTAVGTYDWRELVKLVDQLSAQIGSVSSEVLRGYGQHLFGIFVARYPNFFLEAASAFDFLENVEGYIHPEVRKLYPDADLPRFTIDRAGDQLTLHYRSQRPFAMFARGLLEGCLLHFALPADVQMKGEGGDCLFTVVVRKEGSCPTPARA